MRHERTNQFAAEGAAWRPVRRLFVSVPPQWSLALQPRRKTTCGYCARVKSTLASEYKGLEYKVVELNTRSDGRAIQDTLAAMTGQRTVPNVFVGGKSIGGCDDTMAMHRSGSLRKLFKDAGALPA